VRRSKGKRFRANREGVGSEDARGDTQGEQKAGTVEEWTNPWNDGCGERDVAKKIQVRHRIDREKKASEMANVAHGALLSRTLGNTLSGRGATENMEGRCAFLFLLARIITNRRQMKTVISERVPVEAQKLLHCSCEKNGSSSTW
jgi:hypothetical protein